MRQGEVAIAVRSLFGIVLLVAAGVAYLGYSQWQFGQLSEALEADIATLHRLRWERPVLRAPEIDGNAAAAAYEALEGVEPLPTKLREGLAEQMHFGQPFSDAQREAIEAWQPTIDALRDATHRTWSATPVQVGLGARMPVPDYPLLFDAALVMIADAAARGGDDCLVRAADAIRYGQDLVPGGPMEASSVSMRINSVAARVVGFCVASATGAGLRKATSDYRTLATQAPPAGSGIEVADLLAAMRVRRLASLSSGDGLGTITERLRRRARLYEEWKFLGRPSKWRKIQAKDYPSALDDWRSEHDWRVKSDHDTVRRATVGVLDYLYDDMRGQALTRSLAVGIATLAERARRGKMPREPLGLTDSALRDPYAGSPLLYRIAQDHSELALWSVGEDKRDDRGTDEWGDDAPLDVVVHLRLPAGAGQRKAGSTGKGRRRSRRGS